MTGNEDVQSEASPSRRNTSHVIILGAGPAGVGAAIMLARSGKAGVTVLERADHVGGNSGSFPLEGVHCDYGSHRLHPASDPYILGLIKDAVGDDLLWRPRHGRILLKGRWIHFPLKPVDLALRLPKSFAAGLMFDAITKPLRKTAAPETLPRYSTRAWDRRCARDFTIPT